jgi:hypothetical protein
MNSEKKLHSNSLRSSIYRRWRGSFRFFFIHNPERRTFRLPFRLKPHAIKWNRRLGHIFSCMLIHALKFWHFATWIPPYSFVLENPRLKKRS